MDWLNEVRRSLDDIDRPVHFFFRDDDIGWRDDRLFTLLAIFERHQVPIDLAAIPAAIDRALADRLLARVNAAPHHVRIHQHGFCHTNHESTGKKCEFGPSRSFIQQKQDITAGQRHLRELFGDAVDSIFTPPWNRCTIDTAQSLDQLGFQILSRESEAAPFEVPSITEIPVDLDWCLNRKRLCHTRSDWAARLVTKLKNLPRIGTMFHHAAMEPDDFAATADLLGVLASHPAVDCRTVHSFLEVGKTVEFA